MGTTIVDLTGKAPASGTINGALFENQTFRVGGTGFINSFLRVHNSPTEQGYNTSGTPVPLDDLAGNFTRNLQLSDIPILTAGSTQYYEFLLDINEPNGHDSSLLSLDQLKIFTNATGSLTPSDPNQLGTLRYNLDAGMDNYVLMDADLTSGSGQGDVRILIPVADFAGVAQTDFVYLYSMFGVNASSGDGFEEFAVRGATAIPLPATAGLAAAGLLGVGAVRRRR